MPAGKRPKEVAEGQVRTSVSMTQGFWHETEQQMKDENYNNFSAYVQFLLKLRREILGQRKREASNAKDPDTDTSLFRLNEGKAKATK